MSSGHHVIVAETHKGTFTQEVTVGAHKLVTDVPEDMGGLNAGPNPYDKLLSALGSCTSMTIKMYADLKKLPLEGVEVKLTHHKEKNAGGEMIDVIHRDILLKGALDDAQKAKLIEIANKCPVHRTLENKPEVATALTPAEAGAPHAAPKTAPLKPRFNPAAATQERAVTVASNSVGKFTQDVTAGKNSWVTDEPVAMGGLDSGPNPYEELLASLGSCTSMKMRRHANVKGYDLSDISVELTHHKEKLESGAMVDKISRDITLKGNLTEDQRQDLLNVANSCPIFETLKKGPHVTTALVEAQSGPKISAAPTAPRP